MSVSCSSEILFDCIFLHIENGVFSLPAIFASTPLDLSNNISSFEIILKLSSLLFLISFNLSIIKVFQPYLFSIGMKGLASGPV